MPAQSKKKIRFNFPKGNVPRLCLIGNSNVGKSSLTKLILSHPRWYKGKIGKTAGSTVRLTIINDPALPYHVIDLPGFGRMTRISRSLEKYVQEEIIRYLEKDKSNIFLTLIVISAERLGDEIQKWVKERKDTIPLNVEFMQLLEELKIPYAIVLNKIDKLNRYKKTAIRELLDSLLNEFNITLKNNNEKDGLVGIFEVSAKQKEGISKLKGFLKQRAANLPRKKLKKN